MTCSETSKSSGQSSDLLLSDDWLLTTVPGSYCAASLAIALSFAAVSSLSEAGFGMAMTL
jgi:hypothetical protein